MSRQGRVPRERRCSSWQEQLWDRTGRWGAERLPPGRLAQAKPSTGLRPGSGCWGTGAACWQDSASHGKTGEHKEIAEISQWVFNCCPIDFLIIHWISSLFALGIFVLRSYIFSGESYIRFFPSETTPLVYRDFQS